MITCDEFFTELGDYLEGRLSPEVREELELHVSQCHACYVLYDSACKTVRIVTDSGSFDLPQGVLDPIIDRVIAKLRTERASQVHLSIQAASSSVSSGRPLEFFLRNVGPVHLSSPFLSLSMRKLQKRDRQA